MKFFNTYLRPLGENETGTEPLHASKPLFIGGLFHTGLEAWLRSGWQDGSYDVEPAIEAMRLSAKEQQANVPTGQLEEWMGEATDLMLAYHVYYGPGGLDPEFPVYQVATDQDGEPLIEQEFIIDLGYRDYIFTSRLDAVMWFNKTYLVALETKTVDVSRVSRLMQQFSVDGQATGEIWLMRRAFPEVDDAGLHLNMIVKRAGKGKDPFRREPFDRSDIDIETFSAHVVRTLREIDEAAGLYNDLVRSGAEVDEAARRTFDGYPDGFVCCGNYPCPYLAPCSMKGHESGWFKSHTKARSTEGTKGTQG